MARIYVYDEFNPEDNAMLQALYSRSPKSVTEHVEQVRNTGSGKFMEKFYVGYGHSSIADCGSTTLFIEGLSILADKAIQDWPLYAGQESSTRYIDFTKQEIIDPVSNEKSKEILDNWMKFYVASQEELREFLKTKYPKKTDEVEKIYDKAIAARSFDIIRGFLPAGVTTQLSWHTNLRQAADKLFLMRYNPLAEVRQIAAEMLTKLQKKYANSFGHQRYEETEKYREAMMVKYNFFNSEEFTDSFTYKTNISNQELEKYGEAIKNRPPKTNLPLFLAELGNITFDFLLDYGSFRDIQRHRNGVCRIPLLTINHGFNDWYLEQLPETLRGKANELITKQKSLIAALDTSPENKQYYIALGFNATCRVSYGLPATVYVVELRSGKTVHPTLRKIAHQMHHALKKEFPNLTLHSDLDLDDWDVRRGLQDINVK